MDEPLSNDVSDDAPSDTLPEDSISLNDALKLTGITGTGGQAKRLIQSGEVRVNGEVETRRKRKLYPGDVIEVDGEEFELELSSESYE